MKTYSEWKLYTELDAASGFNVGSQMRDLRKDTMALGTTASEGMFGLIQALETLAALDRGAYQQLIAKISQEVNQATATAKAGGRQTTPFDAGKFRTDAMRYGMKANKLGAPATATQKPQPVTSGLPRA